MGGCLMVDHPTPPTTATLNAITTHVTTAATATTTGQPFAIGIPSSSLASLMLFLRFCWICVRRRSLSCVAKSWHRALAVLTMRLSIFANSSIDVSLFSRASWVRWPQIKVQIQSMNHAMSQSLTRIIHIWARAHRSSMLALFSYWTLTHL